MTDAAKPARINCPEAVIPAVQTLARLVHQQRYTIDELNAQLRDLQADVLRLQQQRRKQPTLF